MCFAALIFVLAVIVLPGSLHLSGRASRAGKPALRVMYLWLAVVAALMAVTVASVAWSLARQD